MKRARQILLIGLTCFAIVWALVSSTRLIEGRFPDSDEATTLLAAHGVLDHGVPRLPSGQIYWRSPLSTYLTAFSLKVGGDTPLGWRAVSFVSFVLMIGSLAVFGWRSGLWGLTLFWLLAVSASPSFLDFIASARMYALYAALQFAALLVYLSPRLSENVRWLFVALVVLAGLAHQYAALFCVGILADQALRLRGRRDFDILYAGGAAVALIVSLSLHFGEHYLPHAFQNLAARSPRFMGHPDLHFALFQPINFSHEWSWFLLAALAFSAWLAGGTEAPHARQSLRRAAVPWMVLVGLVGLALPDTTPRYVMPLIPVSTLVIGLLAHNAFLALGTRWKHGCLWLAGIALVFGVAKGLPRMKPPVDALARVMKLRDGGSFVSVSTDPEVHLRLVGPVAHEVRSVSVGATEPCAPVVDDQLGNPYLHDACGVAAFVGTNQKGTVLLTGSRLSSPPLDGELLTALKANFKPISLRPEFQIYCRSESQSGCDQVCQTLGPDCVVGR